MNQDATSRDVMTMTPEEVAQRLGISAWWVREQIRRGRVPHLRFGRRRIALLPAHVDAIIELVTVEPVGWQGNGESDGPASGSGGDASVKPPMASGTASVDLTALHPTDRSVRAHRRRPHVQGDQLF
ncbi:helix-turn-helix domain-containing protein [Cellulomonas sp. P24]|uniref:helix-turn-helix domain-containing protein n=1 Tax=Cellulomonas sp. P24 TaxID=2885206 RepID=UPI00216B1513|nr:helix-turn-helix domain-containing protein [Cellulomonas sp. P24]MCR6491638.1 helix-turn-helix domain-containing protein [Cellulomonas sp. P24]MDA8438291.1 helix-turn-helix domain-containing protein [Propionibacterium sp.]